MATKLTQYGQAVLPLSDVVDKFCLKQGNTRESSYIKYLSMAEWAWEDMFRSTIWSTKKIVLEVNRHTHSIQLPQDCENLINISVIDSFNRLHPLSYDGSLNTSIISCQKCKCSCKKCNGNGTLCSVIDSLTMTTETVLVKGTPYTLTTYLRYGSDGNLLREQIVPTWDTDSSAVIMQTIVENIYKFDIDSNGCIKPTAPNMQALISYAGWSGNWWEWNGWFYSNRPYWELIPASYNYYGYWNYNAADQSIIQIFRNGPVLASRNHDHDDFHEGRIHKVIVTYQTNGSLPGEEILIPKYAEMAINAGIIYQQRYLNPKDGDRDNHGISSYRARKMEVMKYLNPIRMDDVIKLQTEPGRW